MRASLRKIRKSALAWFRDRPRPAAPAELPAALRDCADQLHVAFGLELDTCHDVAMSAFSEISAQATGCYIDLELTTRHQVFVVDERAGVRRVIPLIDLVRILGPVQVAKKQA